MSAQAAAINRNTHATTAGCDHRRLAVLGGWATTGQCIIVDCWSGSSCCCCRRRQWCAEKRQWRHSDWQTRQRTLARSSDSEANEPNTLYTRHAVAICFYRHTRMQTATILSYHAYFITLRAKLSGAVYCYRSCLWRAGGPWSGGPACVCVFVGLLAR